MANVILDNTHLTNIADAIRFKSHSEDTYKPSEMAAAVLAIPTGIDTSDATAVASDIQSGKTAYARGSKLTGTAALTYTAATLRLDLPDWAVILQ